MEVYVYFLIHLVRTFKLEAVFNNIRFVCLAFFFLKSLLPYAVLIFYRAASNICFRIVIFIGFVIGICRDESVKYFFNW